MSRELINHVQSLVKPRNELPAEPDSADGKNPLSNIGAGSSYRRPEPPPWVFRPTDRDAFRIEDRDELAIDEDSEAAFINVEGAEYELPAEVNPDTLAYYLPFHFYRSRWGIYVKATGVLAVARRLLKTNVLTKAHLPVINGVCRVLIEHEAFHHYVELAIARLETPPVLLPSGSYFYQEYFRLAGPGEDEEAMANAHAFRELSAVLARRGYSVTTTRGIETLVAGFMLDQPAGYRDFERYTANSPFRVGKDDIIDAARSSVTTPPSWAPAELVPGRHYFRDRNLGECPVFLVMDRPISGLSIARYFPNMFGMRVKIHTNDHPPAHFHLEKPVGQELGRYCWPTFKALPGAMALSGKDLKDLHRYIDAVQPEFLEKMRTVYPEVDDIP